MQRPAQAIPTAADLARQAIETLDLQRSFFQTPKGVLFRGELLGKCRDAERKLRQMSESVLKPPTLFD
jgi:hypothetical protein